MKVKDLIDELEKCDEETPVCISDFGDLVRAKRVVEAEGSEVVPREDGVVIAIH